MKFSTVRNLFRREADYYQFKTTPEVAGPNEYLITRRQRSDYIKVSRADGSVKTFRADQNMATELLKIGIPLRFQDRILNQVWNFGSARVKVKNPDTWGGTETPVV